MGDGRAVEGLIVNHNNSPSISPPISPSTRNRNMKKLFIIIITALLLTACGGPKVPEGFVLPDTPPNPDLMQPSGSPVK